MANVTEHADPPPGGEAVASVAYWPCQPEVSVAHEGFVMKSPLPLGTLNVLVANTVCCPGARLLCVCGLEHD